MYRLCPFFYFTKHTRIKCMWGSEVALKCISRKQRFEELCPHVCNSVKEFLLMSLVLQHNQWSLLCSSIIHPQNIVSNSKSGDWSHWSSLLDGLLKDCSDLRIVEGLWLICVSIGRGEDSPPPSLCVFMESLMWILICCVRWLWIKFWVFNLVDCLEMLEGDLTFLECKLV